MANSSRMLALLGLLAIAGYQHRDQLSGWLGKLRGPGSQANPQGNDGSQEGPLSGLQNAFGGDGSSGIAGGLRDLIDRFTGTGQEEVAQSWVRTGPNQQPSLSQLEQALGEETIDALTRQTGLSRSALLERLQAVLPNAVDSLTPEGRLPTDNRQEQLLA
jgi:uncharacterized protein YidB (DUF937 family)